MNKEAIDQDNHDCEMDRIRLLQYDNLRENFNKNLVNPILGENYYNLGMDVYTADQFTIEDLKYEFDRKESKCEDLKFNCFVYKFLLLLAIISNLLLLSDIY